jgi:hypothetical protein
MVAGTTGASFSHQGSLYLVETRARVIIFDIAAFEADLALQQRSSFLVPPSADQLHRPLSREHSLMSWPENFYKPRQTQNPEETDRKANSLSARAMQLSIYGSVVQSVLYVL